MTDPKFDAWIASLPDKHWAKTDIAACREGWDAHAATLGEGVSDEVVQIALHASMNTPQGELGMRAATEAVLPHLRGVSVPDGWKLVPIEPTENMVEAVNGLTFSVRIAEDDYLEYPIATDDCEEIYKAMLAAAPQPGESE